MKADGDKEMREHMRNNRGGYRRNVQMRRNATDQYEEGYRQGYKAGYEDGSEDENETMMENHRGRYGR